MGSLGYDIGQSMGDFQIQNMLIVGHLGRMGSFFQRKFKSLGLNVRGIDLDLQDNEHESYCQDTDLVLLCVPVAAMKNVLLSLGPHLPKHCIVTDITSVKVVALEHMQKYWSGPVVGTHPLFGPKPPKGSDLPVAIVPAMREFEPTSEEQVIIVEKLFESLGCRTFRCTATKHDKAMAAIQNLNFITSLAYFATLAQDEDLLPFITPSFKRRQDAAQKMLTEDAKLFEGLFNANPHSHEYVRKYRSFLNIAAGGDIELLSARAAWWWE